MISVDGVGYSFNRKLPAGADRCTQFFLLRLLLGTVTLHKGGVIARQRTNYSVFPCGPQLSNWSDALAALNGSYGSNVRTSAFLKASISDNRVFFRDILNEFSHYFLQTSRGCHLAAFVSLYRTLERFSYSVPLLYCSTQRDFGRTFDDLKRMLSGNNVGEIGLFNTFLRVGGLIDHTVLDSACKISFTSVAGLETRYYEAAEKCYSGYIVRDPTRASLELKFGDVGKLIVSIRNRFFHLLSGGWQQNISMTDIWDADEFFEGMNDVFCNFLAVVLVSVLVHKYSE